MDKAVVKKSKDIILIKDLGKKFNVYNGKEYIMVNVKNKMIGRYFGEFIETRKRSKGKESKKGR